MLKIHSFFKGFYQLVRPISKRLYRVCAIVTAGALVIAVIALTSKDFGGTGKNRMVTTEFRSGTAETEYEEEDSMALAANNGTVEMEVQEVTVNETASSVEVSESITETETIVQDDTVDTAAAIAGQDYEILCRIVQAEAGGEDEMGKLLVANVVLNRVKSDIFPDSITEVVYDKSYGVAQFQPTVSGSFNTVEISDSTKESVDRALAGEDYSNGALYFAVRTSSNSWFNTELQFLFEYSGHYFYK